jgi:hypothetical protein
VADVPPELPPLIPVGNLYAHTSTTLYRLQLATSSFAKVGTFSFNKNDGYVTDIAVDRNGVLFALTFDDVFQCNVETAACLWLASLPGSFNGMTFVPEGTVLPDQEALIGIAESGTWTHVQVVGGKATLKALGSYGGGWLSSGDAFSVVGVGTYATLKGKGSSDSLALVDPKNGKIIKVIGETGASSLFGLAWWQNVFYAFSSSGKVYTLDTTTGKATQVQGISVPSGAAWWGAGVSTRAAGK